ncbi:hypothetical protein SBA4_2440013 [Candidatus Sulfopaludibacter sp. SbA4]|nr:hypothetical protein SBA4_2440013 [Candidatus Sulfopaludibacter sp. SbA4]
MHPGCLFAVDLVLSGGMEELTGEALTVRHASTLFHPFVEKPVDIRCGFAPNYATVMVL